MKYEERGWYSSRLNKWMNIKIYGHYGKSFLVLPCQDKNSDDFANNGMIAHLANYIEEGKIKLFCVDGADEMSVSSTNWNKEECINHLNDYYFYIIYEVIPFIKDMSGQDCLPFLIGASMGASHATNLFFRFVDNFDGIIALSGGYDMPFYFDSYCNSVLYDNSPLLYLPNMDNNHPYIAKYNAKRMIFVVGQGDYEFLVLDSNLRLKQILQDKHINAWFDIWSKDYPHDWSAWKIYLSHYLPLILY